MKKYLLGIIAVVFAVGLSSFTIALGKKKVPATENLLYWYPVNQSTSVTTAAYTTNDYKSNVLTIDCNDDANQPICFFGSTNSMVTIGTYVGGAAAANLIRKKN